MVLIPILGGKTAAGNRGLESVPVPGLLSSLLGMVVKIGWCGRHAIIPLTVVFPATYLAQQHPPRRQTKGMLCALQTVAIHSDYRIGLGRLYAFHVSACTSPRATTWWTTCFVHGLPVLVARPSRFKASAIA